MIKEMFKFSGWLYFTELNFLMNSRSPTASYKICYLFTNYKFIDFESSCKFSEAQ